MNRINKNIYKCVLWHRSLPAGTKSFFAGIKLFTVLYGGAILENQVQVISKGDLWPQEWGHAAIVLLGVLTVSLLWYWGHNIAQREDQRHQERKETLQYGTSLANQYFNRTTEDTMARLTGENSCLSKGEVMKAFVTNPQRLQSTVDDAYQLFESRYGQSSKIENRIDFEVTFITKSYKDGYLTIAASANRNRRSPQSMGERARDCKIYENTIAAELYRLNNSTPVLRIIENTEKDESYKELYPRQKERIKSSLVHPVLSPNNELVGVLVVHCNKAGFFQCSFRKFWDELLETFAMRLAFDKVLLDTLANERTMKLFGLQPAAPF